MQDLYANAVIIIMICPLLTVYYIRRRLASEGIVALGVTPSLSHCVCVCVCVRPASSWVAP